MYDDYGGTYHCWLQVNKPLVYGQVIIITVIVIFTFTIIEAQCLKITQKKSQFTTSVFCLQNGASFGKSQLLTV